MAHLFEAVLPLHDGARLINIIYLIIALLTLGYVVRGAGDTASVLVAVLLFLGCLGLSFVIACLFTVLILVFKLSKLYALPLSLWLVLLANPCAA